MRPSYKEVEKDLEVYLDEELILTVDRSFKKSELFSWEVDSKEVFFERFSPLERRYALRLSFFKLAKRSMHSEEVRRYLRERHFSIEAQDAAIYELTKQGFLNDQDFEAYFVKKWQKQGKSRRQIEQKAQMKGIAKERLVSHYGTEEETLRALIEKKYPILLEKDAPFDKKQKALGALSRRGFTFSSISCALKDFYV